MLDSKGPILPKQRIIPAAFDNLDKAIAHLEETLSIHYERIGSAVLQTPICDNEKEQAGDKSVQSWLTDKIQSTTQKIMSIRRGVEGVTDRVEL